MVLVVLVVVVVVVVLVVLVVLVVAVVIVVVVVVVIVWWVTCQGSTSLMRSAAKTVLKSGSSDLTTLMKASDPAPHASTCGAPGHR